MKALLILCLTGISLSLRAQSVITEASGNVGIGTTTPSAKLYVNGSTTIAGPLYVGNTSILDGTTQIGGDLNATYGAFLGNAQIGTWGYATQFQNANFASTAVTVGYNPFAGYRYGLTSTANVDQNVWTTTPSSVIIGTSNLERFRVNESGNVTMGGSATIGGSLKVGSISTATDTVLYVNGFIKSRKLVVKQAGWADYVFNSGYKLRSLKSVQEFIKINKHLPDVPSAKTVTSDGLDLGSTQAVLLRKIEELTLYLIEQQKQIDQMKITLKKVLVKK